MIRATLFNDAACPWGYSANPALRVLEWRYGGQLEWRLVMIGLREEAIPGDVVRSQVRLRRFRDLYGMPFTLAPKPRTAGTGRGCRAVVAARHRLGDDFQRGTIYTSDQAHHSVAGVYDMKGEKEIKGALGMIKFVNPHGSITITVKNADGTTTDWTFTTGSATTLAQRGISKIGPHALKVGEPLTAKFIPARNGSPLGFLKSITRADGTVMNISSGNPAD